MSTPPSTDEFEKLQLEIEERKKRLKEEAEDLDRNLESVKKLKADRERAAQLYEADLRELEDTMLKANVHSEPREVKNESKPTDFPSSPTPFSNTEKTTMKARVDLELKKVKEEQQTTNSPIRFSYKGSIAGDHSGTKDAYDFVFSQKKHKNEVQNPEARGANYHLNRRCDLMIITYIKNNLHKEDLERFGQSCFGQFLKINELEYQGQLVLHLLLHIDMDASNREKLVFKINNSEIEFGPREFSQITGLRFGTLDETITTSSSSIREKFFKGFHRILVKDIKEAFLRHEGKDELKLKLSLLYFLYGTLLAGHIDKRIEVQYLHLIEDLEKFNEFPWGVVVFNFLVSSILSLRGRLDHVTNKKTTLDLNGFSFVLQVWAYEVMPLLADYCAIRVNNCEKLTPRILRWFTPKKVVSFNDLKKFFTPGDEALLVELEDATTDPIPRPEEGKLLSDKDQKSRATCSSSAAGDIDIIIIDSDDEIPAMEMNKRSKRGWGEMIKTEKRSKLSAASDSQSADSDDGSCSTTYMNTYIFNAST